VVNNDNRRVWGASVRVADAKNPIQFATGAAAASVHHP